MHTKVLLSKTDIYRKTLERCRDTHTFILCEFTQRHLEAMELWLTFRQIFENMRRAWQRFFKTWRFFRVSNAWMLYQNLVNSLRGHERGHTLRFQEAVHFARWDKSSAPQNTSNISAQYQIPVHYTETWHQLCVKCWWSIFKYILEQWWDTDDIHYLLVWLLKWPFQHRLNNNDRKTTE